MSEFKVIKETIFGVIVEKGERSCKKCKYFEKSFDWCAQNCECDTLERYLTESEEQEYYSSKITK